MKVRELLADESKWTKGAFARDIQGVAVAIKDTSAVCFCLVGAITQCYDHKPHQRACIFHSIAQQIIVSPVNWNDDPERTFAEVKALVEKLDI